MTKRFTKNIAPFVLKEINQAKVARQAGRFDTEFSHLENAHVLGQESTYWHVKTHGLMLLWALRHRDIKECLGQLFRIIGAATKTAIGLVPKGNTGGSNVSPFRVMLIKPEHEKIIASAKGVT